jgi:hypothetical protein
VHEQPETETYTSERPCPSRSRERAPGSDNGQVTWPNWLMTAARRVGHGRHRWECGWHVVHADARDSGLGAPRCPVRLRGDLFQLSRWRVPHRGVDDGHRGRDNLGRRVRHRGRRSLGHPQRTNPRTLRHRVPLGPAGDRRRRALASRRGTRALPGWLPGRGHRGLGDDQRAARPPNGPAGGCYRRRPRRLRACGRPGCGPARANLRANYRRGRLPAVRLHRSRVRLLRPFDLRPGWPGARLPPDRRPRRISILHRHGGVDASAAPG